MSFKTGLLIAGVVLGGCCLSTGALVRLAGPFPSYAQSTNPYACRELQRVR